MTLGGDGVEAASVANQVTDYFGDLIDDVALRAPVSRARLVDGLATVESRATELSASDGESLWRVDLPTGTGFVLPVTTWNDLTESLYPGTALAVRETHRRMWIALLDSSIPPRTDPLIVVGRPPDPTQAGQFVRSVDDTPGGDPDANDRGSGPSLAAGRDHRSAGDSGRRADGRRPRGESNRGPLEGAVSEGRRQRSTVSRDTDPSASAEETMAAVDGPVVRGTLDELLLLLLLCRDQEPRSDNVIAALEKVAGPEACLDADSVGGSD